MHGIYDYICIKLHIYIYIDIVSYIVSRFFCLFIIEDVFCCFVSILYYIQNRNITVCGSMLYCIVLFDYILLNLFIASYYQGIVYYIFYTFKNLFRALYFSLCVLLCVLLHCTIYIPGTPSSYIF